MPYLDQGFEMEFAESPSVSETTVQEIKGRPLGDNSLVVLNECNLVILLRDALKWTLYPDSVNTWGHSFVLVLELLTCFFIIMMFVTRESHAMRDIKNS